MHSHYLRKNPCYLWSKSTLENTLCVDKKSHHFPHSVLFIYFLMLYSRYRYWSAIQHINLLAELVSS